SAAARGEVATQPDGEAVETGEEDALGDVRLVELVANFPLQLRGQDDAPGEPRVALEPLVHARLGRRHQREERVLVDDALVEGGRLEEDDEVVAELVELRQSRRALAQQI